MNWPCRHVPHHPPPHSPLPAGGADQAQAKDELPDGWAVAFDPAGKPYYYHKVTQKTQWDKPTA